MPTARPDGQHPGPGRLGGRAGATDRPSGRGVRRDRFRAAAGDPRHRDDDRPVHQHAAGAGPAGSGRAADRQPRAAPGRTVRAAVPPAREPRRIAARRRGRAAFRHAAGVRELPARFAGRRGGERAAHHRRRRRGSDALPARPDRRQDRHDPAIPARPPAGGVRRRANSPTPAMVPDRRGRRPGPAVGTSRAAGRIRAAPAAARVQRRRNRPRRPEPGRAVPSAGPADTGSSGRRPRRRHSHLPRAQRADQPVRTPPHRPRCRAGQPGRGRRAPVRRTGHRPVRGGQDRRRLRSGGARPPRRTHRVHLARRRSGSGAHHKRSPASRAEHAVLGRAAAGVPGRRSRCPGRRCRSDVRALHVGIDRPSEGRGRAEERRAAPSGRHAAGVPTGRR